MALIYASPAGNDANAGSAQSPLRTLKAAHDKAKPKDCVVLFPGKYSGDVTFTKRLYVYPRSSVARALIEGRLVCAPQSAGMRISSVNLDGRNAQALPSWTVNAPDVVFEDVVASNYHQEIGFLVGSDWGRADKFKLLDSVVHNCGRLDRQANPNEQDHGIYVGASTGFSIEHCQIFNNADRGIQLYPDAQDGLIEECTIVNNGTGVQFSGAGAKTSSGNRVRGCTITGNKSTLSTRYDVMSWYPFGTPAGTDNVVEGCVVGTQPPTLVGFAMRDNLPG